MNVTPSLTSSANSPQKHSNPDLRRTSSGRLFPGKYKNEIPHIDITRRDDSRAVQDLEESSKKDRIVEAIDQIKALGFETPYHLILDILQCTPPGEIGALKKWLSGDGMPLFFKACTEHAMFRPSQALDNLVTRLSKVRYRKEMAALAKLDSLHCSLSALTFDQVSNFSVESLQNDLTTTAPTLMTLLGSLVLPAELPAAIGSDGISESDSEYDEEPNSTAGMIPSPTRKLRSRRIAVQTSISILLYARSQQCNLVPALLGYFLHSSRVPKRAIEALHRFGICVTYESVLRGMKSVAAESIKALQDLASSFPPLFAYVDNMNFHARVRDQRLDNRAQQHNYTVGYIGLNPHPTGKKMLPRENPTELLKSLGAEHLMPTDGNLLIYSENCFAAISGVLHTYFASSLEHKRDIPIQYQVMFKLSTEPTKIFTLPAYEKNEAIIDEMIEVLRSIMQALGYTREQVKDKTILFSGDYLSIRNIRFLLPRHRLFLTCQD